MISRKISVATGTQLLLPSMYGLGRGIRAYRVNLFGRGTPVWFVVTFKVLFSSSKLRVVFTCIFPRGCRSLFSDKAEPKMYNIWHQMLKIASAFGVQTQLRNLRRSP